MKFLFVLTLIFIGNIDADCGLNSDKSMPSRRKEMGVTSIGKKKKKKKTANLNCLMFESVWIWD